MFKFAVVLLAVAGSAFAQEKLYATHLDMRTTIALKAPDAAVQKMLPAGWELNPPTGGPAKGANLTLVLVDQVMFLDENGKPKERSRGVTLAIPARKTGGKEAGSMIVSGLYSAGNVPGAYEVYMPADVTIDRKQRADGDGKVLVEERWTLKGPDGHAFEVHVAYVRGAAAKAKTDSKAYSGARPDFYRIYRADVVSDVARSVPNGEDRVSIVSVKVKGQKYAQLFDGSEKIIAITSIPSFSREIFLPVK